jgi:hypothetical protein
MPKKALEGDLSHVKRRGDNWSIYSFGSISAIVLLVQCAGLRSHLGNKAEASHLHKVVIISLLIQIEIIVLYS